MAVKVQKTTIATATVKLLNSTPVSMLAAPAAGFVNNILGITHSMTYVSATYATATELQYYTTSGTVAFHDEIVFLKASTAEAPLYKENRANTVFSTEKALFLTADANPTVGDSNIDVYIIYEVVAKV